MIGLPLSALLGSVAASVISGREISSFFMDPRGVRDPHELTGIVSNVGIILWCSGAFSALLAGWVLRRERAHRESSWFLLAFGTISLVMALDDLLMVHEGIARDLLGLPELLPLAVYMLMTLAAVLRFASSIRAEGSVLLAVSLACFAGSVGIDIAPGPIKSLLGDWNIVFEDSLKLFGITLWAGFFARASMRALGRGIRGEA